ncbi:hypothetical protein EJP67_18490 [Variovorax guangxiensis]|uniref:Uncharacterized protein n=1 Tax=Variovorax guangxiensis TaxID=1775474 RepID=A0A3S0XG15_9BURK|nr:hypothetical protein [Variovorax guangxiensis]RUR69050.1 hypothetical protein EJP67_18490 [Variovorax guangxiensis]
MATCSGTPPPQPAFKDIRNQRPSTAEEKAALCLTLGELCRKVPHSICNGGVKSVREWRAHLEQAKKVLGAKRSSIAELTNAIAQMRSYA